jgi:hypothetical protein
VLQASNSHATKSFARGGLGAHLLVVASSGLARNVEALVVRQRARRGACLRPWNDDSPAAIALFAARLQFNVIRRIIFTGGPLPIEQAIQILRADAVEQSNRDHPAPTGRRAAWSPRRRSGT